MQLIPGIWIVMSQFCWMRTIGEMLDAGDVLIRPVSGLGARLMRTHRLQYPPPRCREIQQQLAKLFTFQRIAQFYNKQLLICS